MAEVVSLEIWSLSEAMQLVAHRAEPFEVVVTRAISVDQAPALLKILELKGEEYGIWEVEELPRLKAVVRINNILSAAIEGYMPYLFTHPYQNACLDLLDDSTGLLLDAAADVSLNFRKSILHTVEGIRMFVQKSRSGQTDPIVLMYLHVKVTGLLQSLLKSTVLMPPEEKAAGAPAAPPEEEADGAHADKGLQREEMAEQVPLEIWSLPAAMELIADHPGPLVVVVTRSVPVYQAPALLKILEQKKESDNWVIQELPRLQAVARCSDLLSALFEGFMPLIINNYWYIDLFEDITWLLQDAAADVSSTFHQAIVGAAEKLREFMDKFKSSPPDSQTLHLLMKSLLYSLTRATALMPPEEEKADGAPAAPVLPQA